MSQKKKLNKKITRNKTHGKVKISSVALLHPWQNGEVFHGFSIQVFEFLQPFSLLSATGPLWASVFDMLVKLPAQALLATLGANKKRLEALNFWTQH